MNLAKQFSMLLLLALLSTLLLITSPASRAAVNAEGINSLAEAINQAGRQRMLTQRIVKAYGQELLNVQGREASLQRQQAIAIVSARQKVVEGAVGMVELAIRQLEEKGVELDTERRAAMVNNLMVAIVSDRSATPVINTGTLYG